MKQVYIIDADFVDIDNGIMNDEQQQNLEDFIVEVSDMDSFVDAVHAFDDLDHGTLAFTAAQLLKVIMHNIAAKEIEQAVVAYEFTPEYEEYIAEIAEVQKNGA